MLTSSWRKGQGEVLTEAQSFPLPYRLQRQALEDCSRRCCSSSPLTTAEVAEERSLKRECSPEVQTRSLKIPSGYHRLLLCCPYPRHPYSCSSTEERIGCRLLSFLEVQMHLQRLRAEVFLNP